MSEFLAEAAVLIRPDTTKFRAQLLADLRAATRGVTVPVPVVAAAARSTAGSTRQTTAAIQQNTAATRANLTAKQQQAIADRAAAAETARLATATRLLERAQAQVAAVEEAGGATTTGLAKARAQLRAATNAADAAQRALTASQVKGAGAVEADAQATLADARAKIQLAKSAEIAAVSETELAGASAVAARKQEQFRRGIEASGLSLFGIRAATLAASSSFLIGAAGVEVLRKSVEASTQETEAAAQAQRVFGDSTEELERHAQSFANTIGVSVTQALRFEAALGNIFENAGFASEQVPKLSEEVLKLGADMAAARNVSLDKTLQALQLALVGNSRGLRSFGIEVNAARVNQEALNESGKTNVKLLTQQEKVQARLNIIKQQSGNFDGAAERRAHSLAGETRRLQANLENLAASIGTIAIPAISTLAEEINTTLAPINKLIAFIHQHSETVKDGEHQTTLFGKSLHILGQIEKIQIGGPTIALIEAYKQLSRVWKDSGDQAQQTGGILDSIFNPVLARFGLTIEDVLNPANQLIFTLDQLQKQILKTARAAADLSFDNAAKSLARFQDQANQITIKAGGKEDLPATLANLQKQQLALQTEVAAAQTKLSLTQGAAGHETALKRLRQARADLADNLRQQVSIRQQMADDAQQAAQDILDAIEKAKQAAQDAIDAANQALQDILDGIARSLDIKQLRVEATTSLADNLAFQRDVQANLRKQIAVVNQMIISEAERAARLHELNVAIVASQIEEKRLRKEIADNRQARRARAFDRAATSIDLDIELAQTQKNVRGEIAARRRRIELDIARQKAVRGDIIATKRLRNDIAEQRAAIKELEKELKKRNEAEQQLEFAFLQRQSGFVTNLLSNILPTSALAGTVSTTGTPSRAISPSAQPLGDSGLVTKRGVGDFATDKASRATPGGVTTSQGTMTISVLRQILHVLQRINAQRTHPEAGITKAAQSVSTDFFG